MSIINPWVFYAMNAISNIREVISVIMITAGVTTCILALVFGLTYSLGEMRADFWNEKTKKVARTTSIVLIILILIYAILPSRETMYQMLVANYVTYDAVDALGEGLQTVVDNIVAAAKELTAK